MNILIVTGSDDPLASGEARSLRGLSLPSIGGEGTGYSSSRRNRRPVWWQPMRSKRCGFRCWKTSAEARLGCVRR